MSASAALAEALAATRGDRTASKPRRPAAAAAAGSSSSEACDNLKRCYLEPASESTDLLAVFSGHFPDAAAKGYEVPFEFRRFLERHPLGVHTLFLRDPGMAWYLEGVQGLGSSVEEVAAFIAEEKRQLGATRLLTLGSSMGGYAALLFGHLLRADVVVAFGPQVYLDQAKRRELGLRPYSYEGDLADVERRVRQRGGEADRHLRLTNLLPLQVGKVIVHVGQNEASDIDQARGLNDQPNVKFVVWPGGNHMVVKALRDDGRLFPQLSSAFGRTEGGKGPGATPSEDAESLRVEGNELVKQGQHEEAAAVYTRALLAGTSATRHLVLANRSLCLLRLGQTEEAWHDADAAHRLHPTYAKALYRRALCEEKRGYVAAALRSAEEARKLDPKDEALRSLEADVRKQAAALGQDAPSAGAPFAAFCE